jgi:uncharacterized protein YndB with AHSA1/START domain
MNDAPQSDVQEAGDIVVECDLEEAPEKVWRALTEPEFVAAWLHPGDIKPEEGARFALDAEDGAVECEVIDVEAERLIRYSWRDETARRHGLSSTVSFELLPAIGGGTHLTIIHGDFRRVEARAMPPAANSNTPLVMRLAA